MTREERQKRREKKPKWLRDAIYKRRNRLLDRPVFFCRYKNAADARWRAESIAMDVQLHVQADYEKNWS
jgi:hypothetical protein